MKTFDLFPTVIAFALLTLAPQGARAAGETLDLDFSPLPSMDVADGKVLGASLRAAAREGRAHEVARLIQEKADVNEPAEYGETALMYAAIFNHPKAAQLLIDAGARVDDTNDAELSALDYAAKYCAPEIARALLHADATVNRVSHEGRTPLMYAAQFGCDLVAAQLLRARGTEINRVDYDGRTALDYAIEASEQEVGGPATRTRQMLEMLGARTTLHVQPTLPSAPGSGDTLAPRSLRTAP